MFCPKCGTENEAQQGYCRQCGQALSGVRLALEGNTERSLEKLKASQKWVNGSSTTLVACTMLGLAITILGFILNDPVLSNIALINLFLGLVIGLPLIFVGKASLKRGARLLSESQTETDQLRFVQNHRADKVLTTGLSADLLAVSGHGSVTEHTTLDLEVQGHVRRKPEMKEQERGRT